MKVQSIRKCILAVEFDFRMVPVRKAVLATAGYDVATAESPECAFELCRTRSFDAVVFGVSVPAPVKRALATQLALVSPHVPIIALSGKPGSDGHTGWADVHNLDSPAVLLRTIESVLKQAA